MHRPISARPLVLALVLSLAPPLALAEPLTALLQDDPGTGGGDAGDDVDVATDLVVDGVTTGWLRGALVPFDDEVDAYRVHLGGDGAIRLTVDPDAPLDVEIELRHGYYGLLAKANEQGAGQAETLALDWAPAGDWVLLVRDVTRNATAIGSDEPPGAPHQAQLSGHVRLETYSMRADCWPGCF